MKEKDFILKVEKLSLKENDIVIITINRNEIFSKGMGKFSENLKNFSKLKGRTFLIVPDSVKIDSKTDCKEIIDFLK